MKSFELYVTYDGVICVEAETEEEALEIAKDMNPRALVSKSSGTWDIDASGIEIDI